MVYECQTEEMALFLAVYCLYRIYGGWGGHRLDWFDYYEGFK